MIDGFRVLSAIDGEINKVITNSRTTYKRQGDQKDW